MSPQELARPTWIEVIGGLLRLAETDREIHDREMASELADSSDYDTVLELRIQREELLSRRRRLLANLRAERKVYETLVGAGRLPAIVALIGEHCAGCHLRLPPQRARAVAGQLPVARCPHCARLLYDPAALERQP